MNLFEQFLEIFGSRHMGERLGLRPTLESALHYTPCFHGTSMWTVVLYVDTNKTCIVR